MKRLLEDIVVTGFGAVTSLFTAALLFFIEQQFDLSVYTFTLCFAVPIGAIGAGFVAASGYYVGAKVFNHRPRAVILLNMVVISLATFFLIRYLGYSYLEVDGRLARDYVSFIDYLDVVIRHSSLALVTRPGSTGELGAWGYIYAFLQVLGFVFGGASVYGWLLSQPYCENCSRYLSPKAKQTRFASDVDSTRRVVSTVLALYHSDNLQHAIEAHAKHGRTYRSKDDHFRSSIEIRYCEKCARHWLKFSVYRKAGSDWKEIKELGIETFSDQELNVKARAEAA